MSSSNISIPHVESPKFDSNVIKWSGYFISTKQAEDHLAEKAKLFANTEHKRVVQAKKDFVNRHFKGYFLYRFTVVVADQD
jgi:hypothetical protein